jgi:hypothetical protein
MTKPIYYNEPPKLLIVAHINHNVKISHNIKFETDGKFVYLQLRGIIYHGGDHFTSRIISTDGSIWYHDGMTTGRNCHADGNIKSVGEKELRSCRTKNISLIVYAQE